jgi:hypothetical protein
VLGVFHAGNSGSNSVGDAIYTIRSPVKLAAFFVADVKGFRSEHDAFLGRTMIITNFGKQGNSSDIFPARPAHDTGA